MKKTFFLLLFLAPFLAFGQEQGTDSTDTPPPQLSSNSKINYRSIVLSSPYRIIRDEGHSPLFHRGPTIQIAAYSEQWRIRNGQSRYMSKFEMVIGYGNLRTNKRKVHALSKVPALNMEINYHYMRPVAKILNGRGDWYLGGIFTNTFDGRLYMFLPNNSFGYEFSNVLNPATHLACNFTLGKNRRHYQTGFKLNFALLAHVIRPNYIGMEPAQTYMGEDINVLSVFTSNNKIVLPNRFIRVNTEIYLDRFKRNDQDKFRFFYGWGMHITRLPESNPLYSIHHTIGVVSMLYTEKNKKSTQRILSR